MAPDRSESTTLPVFMRLFTSEDISHSLLAASQVKDIQTLKTWEKKSIHERIKRLVHWQRHWNQIETHDTFAISGREKKHWNAALAQTGQTADSWVVPFASSSSSFWRTKNPLLSNQDDE